MGKLHLFIPGFFLFAVTFFAGCLRTYHPSIFQSGQPPMIFEADNNNSGNSYLNAGVTIAKGSYDFETVRLLRGSYIFVNTKNFSNINARVFGYTGYYKVNGLEKYNGAKNLFGLGFDAGANINFKIKKIKLGVGLNFGITNEFGEYYRFRKKAEKEGIINSETGVTFVTFSIFPLMSFSLNENTNLSAQFNVGVPGYSSLDLTLNNNGYVFWVSWIPGLESQNQGFNLGFMLRLDKFIIL